VPRLIIANSRTEEMVGDLTLLTEEERVAGGWAAQRMFWFAADGDVLVLPWVAEDRYVDYVLRMTGTDRSTLVLLVPPAGELGEKLLTPDRLADGKFRDRLREALAGKEIDRVLAVCDDPFVVDLAEAVGVGSALPGRGFSGQRGGALVNSKAAFRAVAAGAGVATAPGVIATRPEVAVSAIEAILGRGDSAMVKKEFAGGGLGNEILASDVTVRAAGAPGVVVLADSAAIRAYVAERWQWLTAGRDRLVVEQYLTGATTVYAEFAVEHHASLLRGTGEMLMNTVAVGEIVPPQSITPEEHGELVEAGRRLCDAFRAMGYRGNISADAVRTADGRIAFTETNGRITGSTHLHAVVRDRVLHPRFHGARVLLELATWSVPSFGAAVRALAAAGLEFDRDSGTGVLLTGNYVEIDGKVMYCVVAEDAESARAVAESLAALPVGAGEPGEWDDDDR
jgi:hypothetical protein